MNKLDQLVEDKIGTWDPVKFAKDCYIFETDVSTDEHGVVRGVTCFIQKDETSYYFSACQPTINKAIKVAALKSVGVSLDRIQETLEEK